MSIINQKNTPVDLDGELAFKYWYQTGSMKKAAVLLAQEGISNPNTKKPFSPQLIRLRALRWVCWNPETARPFFEAEYLANRQVLTDERWRDLIIRKSLQAFVGAKGEYMQWIKQYGMEDYRDVILKRFPDMFV